MVRFAQPAESERTTGANHLLLVVEDDPDLLEMMRQVLRKAGYRVVTAKHGEEALERVAEEEPELVLLDMRMPVMDGWEFMKAFRERYGRSIPVVVVTAAEDSQLRASAVGADSHLGKPFEPDRLFEVVADTLGI